MPRHLRPSCLYLEILIFFSVFAWGLTKDVSSTFTDAKKHKSPVIDVIASTQRDRGAGLAGYQELGPGGVLEDKKEYSSGGGDEKQAVHLLESWPSCSVARVAIDSVIWIRTLLRREDGANDS